MKKKFSLKHLLTSLILFSIIFFFLGVAYQNTKMPEPGANRDIMRESGGMRNDSSQDSSGGSRGVRGGQIIGELIRINENSLTLKLNDGGSNTIYITEETFIGKMEKIDKDYLEEGLELVINGKDQDDQGIIAESIQIRQ